MYRLPAGTAIPPSPPLTSTFSNPAADNALRFASCNVLNARKGEDAAFGPLTNGQADHDLLPPGVPDAVRILDDLPENTRTVAVHLMLGRLHEQILCQSSWPGVPRSSMTAKPREMAINAYTRALQACPWALEAVFALARLGATRDGILQSALGGNKGVGPWIVTTVEALVEASNHKYRNAAKLFTETLAVFRDNVRVCDSVCLCSM